jgi:regulator of nonsense transcripts 2
VLVVFCSCLLFFLFAVLIHPFMCVQDLDDAWCIEFCHLNNRGARRRLVRTLFNVSRTSLELLSHYSRIAAVLSQELPDIGITLVQQLEDEFTYHFRKKDLHTLEAKVKNIRFIGELTKVQVADANVALTCLKDCLEDFTQHNVDVACHLLETCGRYQATFPHCIFVTSRAGTCTAVAMPTFAAAT